MEKENIWLAEEPGELSAICLFEIEKMEKRQRFAIICKNAFIETL